MSVVALIVTYNRKELLKECMAAVMSQSRPPESIVVINNASTDGTEKLFVDGGEFSKSVIYKQMNINAGGAGGFYKGIEFCQDLGDWIWLMDDDCIPDKRCLETLICSAEGLRGERFSFLASAVLGPHGEAMNLPTIDMTPSANGYPAWYMHLGQSLVRVKTATFVSLFLRSDAVKSVGLPIPWYFLWGDDTEYTLRLTRDYGPGYFVGRSSVLHKRKNARQLSVWTEDNPSRISMYFYFVRNQLFNVREYEGRSSARVCVLRFIVSCVKNFFTPGLTYRFERVGAVGKGVWAYLRKSYNSNLGASLVLSDGGGNAE